VKPQDPRDFCLAVAAVVLTQRKEPARDRADLGVRSLAIDLFMRVDKVGITFQRAQPGVYLAVTRSFAVQKSETEWLKIISSGA
jgi:hypothetical protein